MWYDHHDHLNKIIHEKRLSQAFSHLHELQGCIKLHTSTTCPHITEKKHAHEHNVSTEQKREKYHTRQVCKCSQLYRMLSKNIVLVQVICVILLGQLLHFYAYIHII